MKKISDEYETITSTDENGRETKTVVYRGNYLEILLDETGLHQFRRTSFLLLLGIIVLHFIAGFVSNQGMYQMYIALPYTIAYFPLLYLGMGIFRLPREKRKYQSDDIRLSFDRMKNNCIIMLSLLCVGGIGEIVYIVLFSFKEQRGLEFLYLGLEVLTIVSVFTLLRLRKKIVIQPWSE